MFDELSGEERSLLEQPFTEEEIEGALSSCDGDKAPCPDGFSLAFFKHYWGVIREDIMVVFRSFLEKGSFERSLNASFIALIPKKEDVENIKDFRPISLVEGVDKLLAKVLANGLKRVLGKVISASQNAFVGGRQILDAVLVTNECIDARKKSGHNGLICKLDIEKVYDHVNWDFLLSLLRKMGFGARWRGWMGWCISMVSMSVLVNGSLIGFFGTSRDLRQGDLLSPFLFVVIMEALSKMLAKAVEGGLLGGFNVSNGLGGNSVINHLLFADDTLMFYGVEDQQLRYLRSVLLCFEAVSGLKVNLIKSELIPIGEVQGIEELRWTLGCRLGSLSSAYLGLPLEAFLRSKSFWDPVIDHFQKRLAGWKGEYLSKGGKLTLIKSTLSSLSTYFMSLFLIPCSVVRRLEKLQRNFLWGGWEDERKMHFMGWERIKHPIWEGGLGIKDLRTFNKALLGKWL
uniref:Reverse transcriptase domain-containing protein n=1 Tax=Davidia involucrata TaxID=16924 RepID=A0A5B7BI34_DAVIN